MGVMDRLPLSAYLVALMIFLPLSGCGGGGEGPASSGLPPEISVGSGPGKATLSWETPTSNLDGSPLDDHAGFIIYYGNSSPISILNSKTEKINNKNATEYILTGLDRGIYYFVVTAYDTENNESDFSNEVSKEIL